MMGLHAFRALRREHSRSTAVVVVVGLLAALLTALTPTAAQAAPAAQAAGVNMVQTADLSKFQPGNIMSDAVFFNGGTMNEPQVQSFLNARVPNCQAGYTCLKNFTQTTNAKAADAYCRGYQPAANEPAARIIVKVAQSCGINPQVLIVTLQKEQGLVTHTWPSDFRYRAAMGQGCPDTAACDTRYYGFQNQVYGAARQFKIYAEGRYFQWYAPGNTWNILFHPNRACGTSPVYVQNAATAGLYYYTPYQPNAAALRAGYGTGDGCSSYGNRNFYQYFTDWFGSTQGGDPCVKPWGQTKASKVYVVNTASLNGRIAPNTACTTDVVSLDQGTIVRATEVSADKKWLKVRLETRDAWVSREYMRYATANEAPCAVPGGVKAASKVYVSTANPTAIGSLPNAECSVGRGTIGAGEIVQALSASAGGQWLKVRTATGDAWASRDSFRYATAAESACATPSGISSAGKLYVIGAAGAVGRIAPVTSCALDRDSLSAGIIVAAEQVTRDRSWLRVSTGAGSLWVPRSSVGYLPAGADVCSLRAQPRAAERGYVALDGATGYAGPSTACAATTELAAGQILAARSATSAADWIQVDAPTGSVWVPRESLRYATDADYCAAPSDARAASKWYVVTDAGAQGRSGPNANCGTGVTALAPGALVQANSASSSTGWLRVAGPSGDTWVPRSALRYAAPADWCVEPAEVGPASLTYAVGAAGTTARTAPDTSCEIGATPLAAGTVAAAVGINSERDWLKLRLPSGDRWVPRADVVRAPAP